MSLHQPKLHPGEWKLAHQSVRFALVPAGDEAMKERILRGQARKFGTTHNTKGEAMDIIRFKGTTYRRDGKDGRPEPKAPIKRDKWRAGVR